MATPTITRDQLLSTEKVDFKVSVNNGESWHVFHLFSADPADGLARGPRFLSYGTQFPFKYLGLIGDRDGNLIPTKKSAYHRDSDLFGVASSAAQSIYDGAELPRHIHIELIVKRPRRSRGFQSVSQPVNGGARW